MNHRRFGFSTQRTASRRGTVIVLAIGLLMIIVMLGSTFLILSRMDSQQSAALAPSAAVPSIAEGLMKTVAAQLKADLYIKEDSNPDNDRVYGRFTGVNTDWRGYVDYPRSWWPGMSVNETVTTIRPDLILGSIPDITTTPQRPTFTGLTNLDADQGMDLDNDGSPDKVSYVAPADFRKLTTGIPTALLDAWWLFDANGSAVLDARTASSVYVNGMAYQAVSTSGDLFPAGHALEGQPIPDAVITDTFARDNDGNQYWAAVRVVGIDALDPAVLGLTDTLALQPYRATRSLPRDINSYPTNMPIRKFDDYVADQIAQGNATMQNALYFTLGYMGASADEAGHMVANLMAKRYSGANWQTEAFAYTPPASAKTYYGVVPQLVITEVFAYSVPDSNMALGTPPPAGDDEYAYAVEIANLTEVAIDASKYILEFGGGALWSFPSGTTLDSGERIVLYDYLKGHAHSSEADYGFAADKAETTDSGKTTYWFNVGGLDFSGGKKVKLIRSPDGSTKIYADSADGGAANYNVNNKLSDPTAIGLGRRDDDPDRKRFLIQEYLNTPPPTGITDHTLGKANGLFPIHLNTVLQGFALESPQGVAFDSLDDILSLYIVGADSTGKSLPEKLTAYANELSGGHPNPVPSLFTTSGTIYPDLPWATMLAEIFDFSPIDGTGQLDTKHTDGKLNINTATRTALEEWLRAAATAGIFPTTLNFGGTSVPVSEVDITDYILAYRDLETTTTPSSHDFGTNGRAGETGISGLRADVASNGIPGFLTPGEVAIPLALYTVNLATQTGSTINNIEVLNTLYLAMADYITTHSDTFGVYITVQLRDPQGVNFDPIREWKYFGIVDRSTCRAIDSSPVIQMFFERD